MSRAVSSKSLLTEFCRTDRARSLRRGEKKTRRRRWREKSGQTIGEIISIVEGIGSVDWKGGRDVVMVTGAEELNRNSVSSFYDQLMAR